MQSRACGSATQVVANPYMRPELTMAAQCEDQALFPTEPFFVQTGMNEWEGPTWEARNDKLVAGARIRRSKFIPRIGSICLLSHLVQGYSRDLEASVASHICCRLKKLATNTNDCACCCLRLQQSRCPSSIARGPGLVATIFCTGLRR